ncbi:MAG: GspH/FimT family pseudopilin [Alphaproteobacteria bacterium]
MRTSSTDEQARRRQAGFTLIELLVVLTIVALAAAVVAPSLGSAVGFGQLRSESRAMVSGLREARAQAMASGRAVDVVLDRDHWRIGEARRHTLGGGRMTVEVPPAGEGAQGTFIRFFPDGRATGGTVHLSRADRTRTIQVDWITGHARQTP